MRQIRRAMAADVPLIVGLVEQYWSFENLDGFDAARVAAQLSRLLSAPQLGSGWLATVESEPAGYLLVVHVFSLEHLGLTAEIDEFFVTSRWRNGGVGVELLRAAEAACTAAGCTHIALQLARSNDRARAFYRRHGYRERSGYELLDKELA